MLMALKGASANKTVKQDVKKEQSFMRKKLKLNIQFFAEAAEADTETTDQQELETTETEQQQEEEKKQETKKTFDEDQVEKIVKDRLARAEKDKQKAIQEAEKLAKMNADEKQKYEFEKLQRENEELKAAQNRYSLGREATKMLAASDIIADDETLEFVVRDDAEATKAAVTKFAALVEAKVDAAVKEKLKGTPPKKSNGNTGTMTKAEIMAIADDFDRRKKIAENPHLFKK